MKLWKALLLFLFLVVLGLGAYVYLQARGLEVEQLTDDLWVVRGMGGNTAVLKTEEGNVIVDTMTFHMQGERIRALARELTGMDTVLVINTHYHFDHTHGNPAFAQGTRVIATERTLSHINALDAEFWSGEAASLKPNETFVDQYVLNVGGQQIELLHPGRGHTDGDLVVHFVAQGVAHMGDLHFNQHYPNIDLEAGGSVQAWPATLDRVLELPFTTVIPGHGATTDRAGLRQYQAFVAQLADIGVRAKAGNWSLEDTLATDELTQDAGYEPISMVIPIGLDRAFVLRRAWEETTGNFERLN